MTTETPDSKSNSSSNSSSASNSASASSTSSHSFSFLRRSQDLAAIVAAASPYAVQVDGGRRLSASGTVFAGDGVIVAASHNPPRDEDVVVGLEGGKRGGAPMVGPRGPGGRPAGGPGRAAGAAGAGRAGDDQRRARLVAQPGRGQAGALRRAGRGTRARH